MIIFIVVGSIFAAIIIIGTIIFCYFYHKKGDSDCKLCCLDWCDSDSYKYKGNLIDNIDSC